MKSIRYNTRMILKKKYKWNMHNVNKNVYNKKKNNLYTKLIKSYERKKKASSHVLRSDVT